MSPTAATAARGFTLVELLIGLAVGLFIAASASFLMLGQLDEHRRVSLETRAEQELRAAAEIVGRELRSAGAWGHAGKAFWSPAQPLPMANPYAEIELLEEGRRVRFRSSEAAHSDAAEDDSVSGAELRQLRLNAGVLYLIAGNGLPQPLTDPATLRVTGFEVALQAWPLRIEGLCERPCNGLADCPPQLERRELRVQLAGEAAHDGRVRRQLALRVPVAADRLQGVCPP